MYEWQHWRTLTPLCAGIAGLFLFVAYSKFFRTDRGHDPLIRSSIFQSRTALASFLGTILQGKRCPTEEGTVLIPFRDNSLGPPLLSPSLLPSRQEPFSHHGRSCNVPPNLDYSSRCRRRRDSHCPNGEISMVGLVRLGHHDNWPGTPYALKGRYTHGQVDLPEHHQRPRSWDTCFSPVL